MPPVPARGSPLRSWLDAEPVHEASERRGVYLSLAAKLPQERVVQQTESLVRVEWTGQQRCGTADLLGHDFCEISISVEYARGICQDSSQGQTTIPKSIREAADLDEGDVITFEVEGDHLVVRKVTPRQEDYLLGLSKVFNEWVSPEDEEAWRDL